MENQMTKTTTKSNTIKYKYKDRRSFTQIQLDEIETVSATKYGWLESDAFSPNTEDLRYDNASLRYTLGYDCVRAENNYNKAVHNHDTYMKAIIADQKADTFETDPKANRRLDTVLNMFAMCVYKDFQYELAKSLYLKTIGEEFTNVSFERWTNSRNNHDTSDAESASARLADMVAIS